MLRPDNCMRGHYRSGRKPLAWNTQLSSRVNNLGSLYQDLGQHARGEELLNRAIEACEKGLGSDHTYMAVSLNNLAGFGEVRRSTPGPPPTRSVSACACRLASEGRARIASDVSILHLCPS